MQKRFDFSNGSEDPRIKIQHSKGNLCGCLIGPSISNETGNHRNAKSDTLYTYIHHEECGKFYSRIEVEGVLSSQIRALWPLLRQLSCWYQGRYLQKTHSRSSDRGGTSSQPAAPSLVADVSDFLSLYQLRDSCRLMFALASRKYLNW